MLCSRSSELSSILTTAALRSFSSTFHSAKSFSFELGFKGLPDPTGLVAGAAGRRIVAVAGRSRDTSGLTMLDTFAVGAPVGSSSLYPFDADDVFVRVENNVTVETRSRFRPNSIGVVYGR